ncbi:MAG: preprotein translocase subunit SecY [Candidatus Gracilibacteria bacterium]|nr:preprotein translocase subunit SecY [Candidatus Gracilibacteria bacterium]MDD5179333.1 preprotein translocase subunit SecY [Candidatus Gracilibacteria bacterium]
MFSYLKRIFQAPDLRKKILFTIFAIVIYRLVSHITVPGVDHTALAQLFSQNELLGVFSILTGGSLQNFSIVLMGLTPYINASIIVQLLTVVIPKLEELSKEGEQGRNKINSYTRWLTFPLAFMQSYGMILLLNKSASAGGGSLIPNITDWNVILPIMVMVTGGTLFIMWLGELMTEKGLGNGISMLIFASIVSGIPPVLGQTLGIAQFDQTKLIPFVILGAITVALTIFVVLVTEGARQLPVSYAGRSGGRGSQSTLPVRINQAGMVPIIFSVSLITFPTIIAQFIQNSANPTVKSVATFILNNFNGTSPGFLYVVLYLLFIIAFTYFYVSITFDPRKIAENIQKRGGFIPGIRPGRETAEYLAGVSNRLNLWGGLFLGFVAVLPILLKMFFASQSFGSVPLLISGAGLIIVVGVVLELIRQINAQLVMHNYDKFN